MNIYVAGPMRGYPEFNFPAFFSASEALRKQGHTVFNPAERDVKAHGDQVWKGNTTGDLKQAEKIGFSLRDALAADMAWICQKADAIYLLPGWAGSKGAQAERALGMALGLKILYGEGHLEAA